MLKHRLVEIEALRFGSLEALIVSSAFADSAWRADDIIAHGVSCRFFPGTTDK